MVKRRTFIRTTGVAAVVGGSVVTGTAALSKETAADDGGDIPYQPKIRKIKYPLATAPQIKEPGETLRVETDTAGVQSAFLTASFGNVTPPIPLDLESVTDEDSELWRFESHTTARFTIPEIDDSRRFEEGMYDLHVRTETGEDVQPRAVSVRDPFPAEPSVFVIGDPHVGDGRGVFTGAEESLEDRDPDPFLFRSSEILGTGIEDRWGPFKKVVAELNAQDPDLIICVGDLTFGQGAYHQEYEDAYEILNLVDAPVFTCVGNHDGYIQPGAGIDGKVIYEQTFGPLFYSVDVRPDLHLFTLDTYDWPDEDRLAPQSVSPTFGGQIRDDQMAWARRQLEAWRERFPAGDDGTIIALGHHNPAWDPPSGNAAGEASDEMNNVLGRLSALLGAEQPARSPAFAGRAWAGDGQIPLRNLLEEFDVPVYINGHSHADQVGRYHGDAAIAQTPGHFGRDRTKLHDINKRGERLDTGQSEIADIMRNGDGPLFVDTTTSSASLPTGEYWGWRLFDLEIGTDHVDPAALSYAASEAFLDEHPKEPDNWDPKMTEFGLYSHPSYFLNTRQVSAGEEHVEIEIDNDLDTAVSGSLLVSLVATDELAADGGEIRWRRVGRDEQDARVSYEVGAGETLRLRVSPNHLRIDGDREHDLPAATGNQAMRIRLETDASRTVELRDFVPEGWRVVAGDHVRTEPVDDGTFVYFRPSDVHGVTYFAESPDGAENSGVYEFGPMEVFVPGADDEWRSIAETTEQTTVAGVDL